jgi:hypothetical protein
MPNQHLQSRGSTDLPREAALSSFKTQPQLILDLLMAAEGAEVPLAEIMVCAAQYNFCIHKLRKSGYKIMNRTEKRNGVLHSWYRLESSPPQLTRDEPPPSQPTSPPQTLSLFPEMAVPAPASKRPVWRDPELGGVKNGGVKHG